MLLRRDVVLGRTCSLVSTNVKRPSCSDDQLGPPSLLRRMPAHVGPSLIPLYPRKQTRPAVFSLTHQERGDTDTTSRVAYKRGPYLHGSVPILAQPGSRPLLFFLLFHIGSGCLLLSLGGMAPQPHRPSAPRPGGWVRFFGGFARAAWSSFAEVSRGAPRCQSGPDLSSLGCESRTGLMGADATSAGVGRAHPAERRVIDGVSRRRASWRSSSLR